MLHKFMLSENEKKKTDYWVDRLFEKSITVRQFIAWTIGSLAPKKKYDDLFDYLHELALKKVDKQISDMSIGDKITIGAYKVKKSKGGLVATDNKGNKYICIKL